MIVQMLWYEHILGFHVDEKRDIPNDSVEDFIRDDTVIPNICSKAGSNYYGFGVVLNDRCIAVTQYSYPVGKYDITDLERIKKGLIRTCKNILNKEVQPTYRCMLKLNDCEKEYLMYETD